MFAEREKLIQVSGRLVKRVVLVLEEEEEEDVHKHRGCLKDCHKRREPYRRKADFE